MARSMIQSTRWTIELNQQSIVRAYWLSSKATIESIVEIDWNETEPKRIHMQRTNCIDELVQTNYARLINKSLLRDILFVFQSNTVETEEDGVLTFECQGMSSAFLLQYRHIGGGILEEELEQSTCCQFPSKYPSYLNYLPDCRPHHSWITMETIRNKVMDRHN
eukprot:scaffold84236_cov37-Attheya_sp.AAC.2